MSRMHSLTVIVLACYTWICYCMHTQQTYRRTNAGEPISDLIHYPIQWLCMSQLVNNLRLLLGAAFGKSGASLFLAHLWYFLHMVGVALMLAALATMLGIQLGIPMLRYIGGATAAFYGVNAVSAYFSKVHGTLEYTDSEDMPRYITKRSRQIKDEPQVLVLPPLFVVMGAVAVTFIVLATVGDSMPFWLQILSVIGQTSVPIYKENQRVLSGFIHLMSLASLMRVQRYL